MAKIQEKSGWTAYPLNKPDDNLINLIWISANIDRRMIKKTMKDIMEINKMIT